MWQALTCFLALAPIQPAALLKSSLVTMGAAVSARLRCARQDASRACVAMCLCAAWCLRAPLAACLACAAQCRWPMTSTWRARRSTWCRARPSRRSLCGLAPWLGTSRLGHCKQCCLPCGKTLSSAARWCRCATRLPPLCDPCCGRATSRPAHWLQRLWRKVLSKASRCATLWPSSTSKRPAWAGLCCSATKTPAACATPRPSSTSKPCAPLRWCWPGSVMPSNWPAPWLAGTKRRASRRQASRPARYRRSRTRAMCPACLPIWFLKSCTTQACRWAWCLCASAMTQGQSPSRAWWLSPSERFM